MKRTVTQFLNRWRRSVTINGWMSVGRLLRPRLWYSLTVGTCVVIGFVLFGLPTFSVDDPRILPHIRTMSYFTSREILDENEAEFIAGHYDIHRGAANYSDMLHLLNPDVWLTWGRNTKAIQDVPDLITWMAGHPEFELERFFLHYREDVTLATPSGQLFVPGWRAECSPNCSPAATAPNEAASRVPDLTDPWWTPNPLYPGLLDFYASTIHQRHAQYDTYQGVFWDWSAGAHVHVTNQLSKTVEYYGIPDQNTWSHPFIQDSIAVIDLAMARYRELYPNDPAFAYTPANTVAPFWMYDHLGTGTNEYRSNLLASQAITHLFFEVWMQFDEHDAPDAAYPSNDVHLKYLKDTLTLAQSKKIILQTMPIGSAASDREKLFLLSLQYLVQNPEQFVLAYHLSEEDDPALPGDTVANWLWVPAMEYNIGLPEINPVGVSDVFGNSDTSVFYEWARASDPGNPGMDYYIYARQYDQALVLAKLRQTPTAAWGESTRTTHQLPRPYRALQVDGTLGPLVESVSLRDDEGVILIESEDYPPSLAPIGNQTISEQTLLELSLTGTDDDPADTLTFSARGLPTGATVTDHHDRTATFAWTPSFIQAGSYPVTFSVTDGTITDSETVTITVTNVNHAPILAAIGNKTIHERDALQFTVLAADEDSDDALTLTAENLPPGAAFTDHHDRTGTFTWTPTDAQAGAYPQIHFTITDGVISDAEDITITVLDGAADCVPAWQCSDWSVCADSIQHRICTDANACGTDASRPAESAGCDSTAPGAVSDLRSS